jgi:transcriptional regulator with XRE-family HTH domain
VEYLKDVGARICALRKQLGITQDALAQMVGYTSRSSINKIEKGLVNLPQSKIAEIASALFTTPAALMGWEEENSPEEPKLTEGEVRLLEVYRRASDDIKPMLLRAMEALEQMDTETARIVAGFLVK